MSWNFSKKGKKNGLHLRVKDMEMTPDIQRLQKIFRITCCGILKELTNDKQKFFLAF